MSRASRKAKRAARRAARADRTRELVTPEGVALRVRVGSAGDRAAAFLIDFLILVAVLIVVQLLVQATVADISVAAAEAVSLLVAFFFRNFYFLFFELRWRGATPGKRALGLRVIDRRGGPLGAPALAARNLVREIELWLPMVMLFAPEALWGGVPGWMQSVSGMWLLVFAFMPLFNRDRLRMGDIVGGTLVVRAPKAMLLPEIGHAPAPTVASAPVHAFTGEQLDIYGIYELQVLEKVLRTADQPGGDASVQAVYERIAAKIGWDRPEPDPAAFLRAFYAALRGRLENQMLLGKRRENKHAPR